MNLNKKAIHILLCATYAESVNISCRTLISCTHNRLLPPARRPHQDAQAAMFAVSPKTATGKILNYELQTHAQDHPQKGHPFPLTKKTKIKTQLDNISI